MPDKDVQTRVFLENTPGPEEELGLSREEFRRRTAHLIPPPGGDLKAYFDEVNKMSEETKKRK